MVLKVDNIYTNRSGESIKIVGSEMHLVMIYYDRKARAYYEDGWPINNDESLRIVSEG